jgi:hypothetical protein
VAPLATWPTRLHEPETAREVSTPAIRFISEHLGAEDAQWRSYNPQR